MLTETLPGEIPVSEVLENVFARQPATDHVVTVHGYGIQIKIRDGHLVIHDGIGRHRRERRYPKADRTLKRIVITGPDGYLTPDALRWCSDHGITVTTLDPDGDLVSAWSPEIAARDARLIRKQATADGLEIARELLTRKVRGQAELILKTSGNVTVHDTIAHYAERMATAGTVPELGELEGWAARDYFALWAETVRIPWRQSDAGRIPLNWLTYPGRSSPIVGGGKKYNAADPVNAMLNYGYGLGYAECRTACIGHGLDPRLGFIHADKPGRDSLALDVLETLRPEIDRCILELVGARTFTYRDFAEPHGYLPGTCRIVAPLTHEIAELSWSWRKIASDAASAVVNILNGSRGRTGTAMPNWKLHRDAFQAENVTPGDVLTDRQWKTIAPLVPVKPHGKGHPPIDSRTIVAAMVYMERHRRPWAHVPASFGISYRTMTERRRDWQRSGDWPDIQIAIRDLAGHL
jgi:CRISP-associated protein Cas1